jgi:RAB6A-GEF complex partner protein 1
MYWPINAPKVYAATPTSVPSGSTFESDDDCSAVTDGEGNGSPLKQKGGRNSRDSRNEHENHNEDILALTVSRNGLMFATITATSLTIWQSKVCNTSDSLPVLYINTC